VVIVPFFGVFHPLDGINRAVIYNLIAWGNILNGCFRDSGG